MTMSISSMMTRSKAKKAVLTPASSSQSIRIVHESEDEDPDFDDVTSAPPISPIYQAVDCHELDPFDTDNELTQELIDQFDLQPIFVSQLEHIGVTIHSTRRLCEIGIFSMESLLLMTENELIQQVSFSFLQNFRIREWRRKLENGREFPIPVGIIGALPVFRGKGDKSYDDPDGFIIRFESVLQSGNVSTHQWAKILSMCIQSPNDTTFWTSHLSKNLHEQWALHRSIFLKHFGKFDQVAKWKLALRDLSQESSESMQRYLDRAAEIIRRSETSMEDGMIPYFIRRGIRSSTIRNYLDIKEDIDIPYTFDTIKATCLLAEARLILPSDPKRDRSDHMIQCHSCKRKGHYKYECTEFINRNKRPKFADDKYTTKHPIGGKAKSTKPILKGKPCGNCGPDADHIFSKCGNNVCKNCNEKGHLYFACPKAVCSSCKGRGHTSVSFDCPNHSRKTSNKGNSNLYINEKVLEEVKDYLELKDEIDSYNHDPFRIITQFRTNSDKSKLVMVP